MTDDRTVLSCASSNKQLQLQDNCAHENTVKCNEWHSLGYGTGLGGKPDLWPLFFSPPSGTFRCDAAKSEYRRQYNYMGFAVFIYIYSHTFSEKKRPNINKNGYRNDVRNIPRHATHILAKYNQQDATFHNLFISVRRSIFFRWFLFFVRHQELKIAHTASGICLTDTATCC